MPAIKVYQGDNVQRQGTTDARFRAADFGPSPLAEGLQQIGKAGSQYVQVRDEIEDIDAKTEANRLLIEHGKLTQQIDQRVKQSLGENAEPEAERGITDLQKGVDDIMSRASPRAKMLLEPQIATRNLVTHDQWQTHGFNEKRTAFDTTAVAANDEDINAAVLQGDEEKAKPFLASVVQRNQERAEFFGWGADTLKAQNRKDVSGYFVKRARSMATNGAQASAAAAVDYAMQHRSYMTDEDYASVVGSYHGAAIEERALEEVLGKHLPSSQVQAAPDPLAPVPEGQPQPTRALDPDAFFEAFTTHWEGSAYVVDSNGYGVKYGINAQYNPGVDVKNLTKAGAAKIFKKNYYEKSGADKLPPALAAVHVDTFYLNEKQAGKILKESGGDVDRYIELRRAFLNGLAAKNPAKYGKYQKGWENRTKALGEYATRLGGDGTFKLPPVTASTNMTEVENEIMARTDVGLGYKRALVSATRERRNALRTEIEIQQSEAADAATTRMVELGDGFTSITQVDPEVVASLSPQALKSLSDAARTNSDRKATETLMPYIDTVEVTDPNKFMSSNFLVELKRKGATAEVVNSVSARQKSMRKSIIDRKPDPVGSGELWTIAKPAFEQSGLYFDTSEGKNEKQKAEERLVDDTAKQTAVSFLRRQAMQWAVDNPGKKPTEEEQRKWVGVALIQVQNGKRFYELTNGELVNLMSEADRNEIVRRLKASGLPNTVGNVADYYRQMKIARGR